MSKQQTYRSYLSSGLSVLALLVFGFFNTSGHVISTVDVLPTRTELLVEQRNSTEDNLVSKFEKCVQHYSNSLSNQVSSTAFTLEHLISYNSLTSVRFHSQSEKFNSFNLTSCSPQVRIIPKNSDDPYKS